MVKRASRPSAEEKEDVESSALITVVGFARPDIMLEIKATAVLD